MMRMGVSGRPSVLVVTRDVDSFDAIADELRHESSYVFVCVPDAAADLMSTVSFSRVVAAGTTSSHLVARNATPTRIRARRPDSEPAA